MKTADTTIVEMREFNGYLILTLLCDSPKLKQLGTGLILTGFNNKDLRISPQALNILLKNLGNKHNEPVLEIIAKDKLWWASPNGIIIPPDEAINVFILPPHTKCTNIIDEKIKQIILK